jgi:chaperone modulatory protein CbpM
MTELLTEDEVLAAIPGLTRTRLVAFIEAEVIIPVRRTTADPGALVFRQVDFARLRFLWELSDGFDLDEAALGVIMTLIDQLHATRRDLRALARAIQDEAPEVRARIGSTLVRSR